MRPVSPGQIVHVRAGQPHARPLQAAAVSAPDSLPVLLSTWQLMWLQWAGSVELRRATTVSCQLLRHRQDGSEAAATLQNSLLAAARAAAAVSPHGVAHIVAAVHAAEAAAAGVCTGDSKCALCLPVGGQRRWLEAAGSVVSDGE